MRKGPAVNGTEKLLKWAAEQGRALGCLPGRRTDQSGCAGRHDQDRPPRLRLRPRLGSMASRATPPIRISPITRCAGCYPWSYAYLRTVDSTKAHRNSRPPTSKSPRSISVTRPPMSCLPRRVLPSTSASTTLLGLLKPFRPRSCAVSMWRRRPDAGVPVATSQRSVTRSSGPSDRATSF